MAICLTNGTLISGYYALENMSVLIENNKVLDVFNQKRFEQKKLPPTLRIIDVEGSFISPGLIDTHIHGFNGHGTDNCSSEAMLAMSEDLAQYGVTAFNPTLYPSSEESMTKTIQSIVKAMGKESGAKIMGIHLEGPFISADKLGVQRPETVKTIDLELMERLWQASEGHIVNMTVAPEIKGMRDLALYCIKKGIVAQAGHTNAEYAHMVEGKIVKNLI